ncbi:MAG: hypothetical protein WCE21_02915 [Candidatus Babeliales bacterium]
MYGLTIFLAMLFSSFASLDATLQTRRFHNILVGNNTTTNYLNVLRQVFIDGDLFVKGTINGSGGNSGFIQAVPGATINAVPRFANANGSQLANSSVLIDNAGNVTLNGITKNGITVAWPSTAGAAGTFLANDGAGNLVYATPAGAGNVSTALNFTTNNALTRVDLPSGVNNIQQSVVTLDNSGNIAGVNQLVAGTFFGSLQGNAASATNFTGSLAGDVSGTQTATVVNSVGGQSAAAVANAAFAVTNATPNSVPNTLVERDASRNFSAGTITASLMGAASLNVLKSGDTMTGPLVMGTQTAVRLQDAGGTNYVGLNAPSSVTSSYTMSMPGTAPVSGQFLQASAANALQWADIGGLPSTGRTIYVSKDGSDSNDGSLSAPFLTVAHALLVANTLSTISNPVVVQVGAGAFIENNSGGALAITADGITLKGGSNQATIIAPTTLSINLFNVTTPNVLFRDINLNAGVSGSTAAAININVGVTGFGGGCTNVNIAQFQTGIALNNSNSTPPIFVINSVNAQGNGTAVAVSNYRLIMQSSSILGPYLSSIIQNTGISLTGINTLATIDSCVFRLLLNGITVAGGAPLRITGSQFINMQNGIVCSGGGNADVVGCNFLVNTTSSINVSASGAGTTVIIDGAIFNCVDATNTPQGTAVQVTTGGSLTVNSSTISGAALGMQAGAAGDTSTTTLLSVGTDIIGCTADFTQAGTSTFRFVGGVFDSNLVTIANGTNVHLSLFDRTSGEALTIGNSTDTSQVLYRAFNGEASLPFTSYEPNYYGSKGLLFQNPNADATFSGVQAASNDANYYVVTGSNTNQAGINLISDTLNIGTSDFVRGWNISKLGTSGNLTFNYSNNDTGGQAARGSNPVMQLDGFNNQVLFPAAINSPLPTNTVAKLVWNGDTDLYRGAAGTLQTDGNLIVGGLTPNTAVTTNGSDQLTSSVTTATELGYVSGVTSAIQPQINNKVSKTGDTMTGPLIMATQTPIRFQDAGGVNYAALNAPTAVSSSYTVSLPTAAPAAAQFLQAATPTTLQWASIGGVPNVSRTIYVAQGGNDSNDGSLSAPFATIAHAVAVANTLSTLTNPVVVQVGAGTFIENNSGGAIAITADGITINGSSITGTIVVPNTISNALFNVTTPNVLFSNIYLDAGTTGSTAAGINVNTSTTGEGGCHDIVLSRFQTGLAINNSNVSSSPIFIISSIETQGNSTAIAVNNYRAIIQGSSFLGPFVAGAIANTGIALTGTQTLATLLANSFRLLSTGITITGGADMRITGSNFDNMQNGVSCSGGSNAEIVGCNFIINEASSVNISAAGAGTNVIVNGCIIDCADVTDAQQGTAVQSTTGAILVVGASNISAAAVGIQCGTTGDTSSTIVAVFSTNLVGCINDITQVATANLQFVGGVFDSNLLSIANSANVTISAFDRFSNNALTIGNKTDVSQPLYKVLNGEASLPFTSYEPNYYGNKGLLYQNPNADATFNGVQAASNDANYYVITGSNTNQAGINLISDTLNIGTSDFVRGWNISKLGTSGNLTFNYSNNDTGGQAARGSNPVMQLDGFNNQVLFPAAINSPLPTNTVAKLVWNGDTDLYRGAAGTLQTDGNLIVGGLTPNTAVTTNGSDQLTSSVTTATEIGFVSGVTSAIQTQLNSKFPASGGTLTGPLTLPAGTAAAPSLNFAGSTTTGLSAATANTLSFDTNGVERMKIGATGTIAIDGFTTAGVVHNDASGNLSSSLIVDADITTGTITDDKLQTITTGGKVANSATTATSANTLSTIVLRDGTTGGFSAGAISATSVTASANPGFFGNLSGNATSATTAASATSFTGPLLGDVTGTQSATVVSTVGGATAAAVATAANAVANATNLATPSTLVLRDSSGNFSGGTITATTGFSGNLTGNVTGNATTATSANTAGSATNFTGSLSGDVTGTQGATVVSFVGGKSAASVANTVTTVNAATSNNTPNTLVLRDGSGNFTTNQITIAGSVTNPTDTATKAYVDSVAATGLEVHTPAVVVSTTNVALSGLQTIDGITLVAGNRVLLVGQTSQVQNGLWVAASGSWTRPTDFATGTEAGQAYVLILEGTNFGGSSWVCTTSTAIIDTDPITFVEFSLPSQTTGANLGSGTGIFANKTGQTLNFKSLLEGTHVVITNDANTVTLATDATSADTISTIVARDGSGNFSAGTITASLIGAASLNVLKAGDTMTGPLVMATQTPIRFQDAGGTNYAALQAPAAVSSSYAVALPTAAPNAGQYLQALSSTSLQWASVGGTPNVSRTIYVSQDGSDSNNGSFSSPFLTIAHAVSVANSLSTLTNPVVIQVGAGVFVEDNSGGAITITADGITLNGASTIGTIVVPNTLSNTLFNVTSPNVLFSNIYLDAGTTGSTAAGVTINTSITGDGGFLNVVLSRFQTGLSINNSNISSTPIFIADGIETQGNGTAIAVTNYRVIIQCSSFLGPFGNAGSIQNTGIALTGSSTLATMLACSFRLLNTGISVTGGAAMRTTGNNFDNMQNGIVCSGGGDANIVGCNFLVNESSSVNVSVAGVGTEAIVSSCIFDCPDATDTPQGTVVQATTGASLTVNSSTITGAVVGIQCGTTGDTSSTVVTIDSTDLQECTNDIMQVGTSTLRFVGGVFDTNAISIADGTNVHISAFDRTSGEALTIGNNTDASQMVYRVLNGQAALPFVSYEPNYYGNKGLLYENANADATFNGVQAASNDVSYYLVTGNNTNQASINLISDTVNFGTSDSVRGWNISKLGTSANLTFNYSNNDTSGQAARGNNPVMQLDGFNNQVLFPAATNTPLPTNTVAKLVWAGDTNLYRTAANTLQTDGNFIIGGNLTVDALTSGAVNPNTAIVTNGTNQLLSSVTTATEIGFVSGVTSSIQTQLNSKFPASGGTLTGPLTLPAGTAAAPSLNFTGSTTTGLSAATANTLSFDTNGVEAMNINASGVVSIDAFTTAGVVHNNASGNLSSSLIVDADITTGTITDDKLQTITTGGKVANSATTATPANTANAIVSRDASGNFAAGAITANTFTANSNPGFFGNLSGNASTATSATTAISFTGPLLGDVTGTQSATVVSMVGGQTAAVVAAAASAVANASSANNPGTLVLRDGSGNFAAGKITITGGTAAAPSLQFSNGTNTGFSSPSANTLSFDVNGTQALGIATNTNATFAGTVTASSGFFGPLTGNVTGNITGSVTLPAGTAAVPSLQFSNGTNTGMSSPVANTLSFDISGAEAMNINTSGVVTIDAFTTAGVVHNNASGNLSSSLIVDADITTGTITDDKLQTISTGGKVANSATTATPANTANAIVSRDASGNFAAGAITANTFTANSNPGFIGNLSGNASTSTSATTAVSFTGPLMGDVTGNQTATVVSTVGGASAASVASTVTTVNAATSSNIASTLVLRNGTGGFSAGTINATSFVGPLTGNVTGNVTGNITGLVTLPAGTAAAPSLNFTGSLTTGLSAATANRLSFDTNGTEQMAIGATGTITMTSLAGTAGVVHNDASGNLSSSLIVNADVSATAAIVDTKLGTIQTAGKVLNSATTATSANTANAIVARDASGNFSAGTITASLMGAVTLPAGTAAVPSLQFTGSSNTGLSAATANRLSFDTSGAERMSISPVGTVAINGFVTTGVVHNDASGNLSSSLIVDADITTGTITNDKLVTLTATGLVANSATTATTANTLSTIVLRDGTTGGFSAGTITATFSGNLSGNVTGNLTGNVIGSASLNVLKAGDTMTGTLTLPAGTAAAPSLQFTGSTNTGISAPSANTLSFDVNGTQGLSITTAAIIDALPWCNQAIMSATPTTGSTITTTATTSILLLKNTTNVTGVTIDFPPNPTNGQMFTIMLGTTSTITMTNAGGTGGATIVNGVTGLNATATPTATANGAAVAYLYSSTSNAWYRMWRG